MIDFGKEPKFQYKIINSIFYNIQKIIVTNSIHNFVENVSSKTAQLTPQNIFIPKKHFYNLSNLMYSLITTNFQQKPLQNRSKFMYKTNTFTQKQK